MTDSNANSMMIIPDIYSCMNNRIEHTRLMKMDNIIIGCFFAELYRMK